MCPGWGIIIYPKSHWTVNSPLWQRDTKETVQGLCEKSLDACNINFYWWSTLAEKHDTWHLMITHVVLSFENTYRITLKNKRLRIKNCNTMLPNSEKTFNSIHYSDACLPVLHWPCQPLTYLHSKWITWFLISVHRAKPSRWLNLSFNGTISWYLYYLMTLV